jgi:hypothetical protein
MGLLDDDDGRLDFDLMNSSTYDALTGRITPPRAALFHNNHDGTFTKVAEQAGVTDDRWRPERQHCPCLIPAVFSLSFREPGVAGARTLF